MILSMLIFWWAVKSFSGIPPNIAATPGEINFLNTKGPYKYVRHPFYLSYIIFWFGASVAVQTIDVLLFVSILVGMYFKAARREEKDIISSAFGDEYLNYKKSVGMFFPMLFRF